MTTLHPNPECRADVGRPGWRAGAATLHFPVAVGTPLDGYAARTAPSTGTLDDLSVSALVIERASQRLVLVTADVAAVDRALVLDIVTRAGLQESAVFICASHTHSGPAGLIPRLHPSQPDRLDRALRSAFITACSNVIAIARSHLQPVTLHLGRATTDGICANRNDPTGLADDTITTIAARRLDGSLLATLVHFTCHPTVLGPDNMLVSADLGGAARRFFSLELPRTTDPAVVLFANGAAADVSSRFTRRDQGPGEVARLGSQLAVAAYRALMAATPVEGELRYGRTQGQLLPRLASEGAATIPGGSPAGGRHEPSSSAAERRRFASTTEGAALATGLPSVAPAETEIVLDGVAIGDLALLAIPGELLTNLGRTIVDDSPFATTLVLGYTNGYLGYFADSAADAVATYETLASPFAPTAGDTVVRLARDLLSRLAKQTGEAAMGDYIPQP